VSAKRGTPGLPEEHESSERATQGSVASSVLSRCLLLSRGVVLASLVLAPGYRVPRRLALHPKLTNRCVINAAAWLCTKTTHGSEWIINSNLLLANATFKSHQPRLVDRSFQPEKRPQ
jgi:hypothetical protein